VSYNISDVRHTCVFSGCRLIDCEVSIICFVGVDVGSNFKFYVIIIIYTAWWVIDISGFFKNMQVEVSQNLLYVRHTGVFCCRFTNCSVVMSWWVDVMWYAKYSAVASIQTRHITHGYLNSSARRNLTAQYDGTRQYDIHVIYSATTTCWFLRKPLKSITHMRAKKHVSSTKFQIWPTFHKTKHITHVHLNSSIWRNS